MDRTAKLTRASDVTDEPPCRLTGDLDMAAMATAAGTNRVDRNNSDEPGVDEGLTSLLAGAGVVRDDKSRAFVCGVDDGAGDSIGKPPCRFSMLIAGVLGTALTAAHSWGRRKAGFCGVRTIDEVDTV
jgi:hypothetical protein